MSQYPGQYSSQANPQSDSMQQNYPPQAGMGQNPWASSGFAPGQNLQASNMNYGQSPSNVPQQAYQTTAQQQGTNMAGQYQTFNPNQAQQNYPQVQSGYMGMPPQSTVQGQMMGAQNIPQGVMPQSNSMHTMVPQSNSMQMMMGQGMPQGHGMIQQGQPMIQQGQAIAMGGSQMHTNIPMGQPIDNKAIPTGLAGNRDREWLLQYGNPNPDEMFLLREWFGTVDQDKTGQIDATKLQTALSASGEKIGENICFLMIKMFDVDGSQSINFIEFAQLYKFIRSMRAAFEVADVTRTNLITITQLHQALTTAGFSNIPPQYAALLFRKFDKNKRQRLSFENFMEMCVILGHTKSWFIAKDTDLDGKVTLTLFELFELIAYC